MASRAIQHGCWVSQITTTDAVCTTTAAPSAYRPKPQAIFGVEVLGGDAIERVHVAIGKVGADEAPAQQGGRAKYALLAAADGGSPIS